MKKYRVSLEVDQYWVDKFDLVFTAEDKEDAETQAMVEVKQNLNDYITAYADEEGDEWTERITHKVKNWKDIP